MANYVLNMMQKKAPGDGSLVLFLLLFVNSNKLTNLDKNKVNIY